MNIQTKAIAAPAIYSEEIKEPSKIKTEFFRRYFRVVHVLFAVLMLIQLLPDQLATETYASYAIWFAVGVEVLTLIASALIKPERAAGDVLYERTPQSKSQQGPAVSLPSLVLCM